MSLTLRDEHRSKVFENWVLRRISGPMRKWQEDGEGCIMISFITCTLHQTLLQWSSWRGWDGRVMCMHGTDEKCTWNCGL